MNHDAKLYNDDCLTVLKNIPDKSIDCIITDCPYHIVSGGCTNDPVKIARYSIPSGILQRKRDEQNDDAIKYTRQGKLFKHNDIEFEDWLPEVYRVLKDDTHCYIMINPRNLKELWQKAENAGFIFQQLIVWDKGNSTPNRWYMNAYELILMLRKGKAKKINNLGSSNIIRVPNITRIKKHPTEKPVDLMTVLVKNSTNENDIVLDPFMGVGGTGLAAIDANRHFVGIEIDQDYYSIAEQRINNPGAITPVQMSIFDYLGG